MMEDVLSEQETEAVVAAKITSCAIIQRANMIL